MEPKFTQGGRTQRPRRARPTVTIRDRGIALVNAVAWEAIGRPQAVVLLYDAEQQILGIQCVPQGAGGS